MSGPKDLITGRPLSDREDEHVRQAVEGLLLERGYSTGHILVDALRALEALAEPLFVRADLLLQVEGRAALVLRCAPGSLVTREKEAVAAARLIADPWAPLAAVVNGEDAELLDTATGKVLAQGLAAIPSLADLTGRLASYPPHRPTRQEMEKAARVYRAFSSLKCPSECVT